METPELKAQVDTVESVQSTPRRKIDSKPVATDSLVTIPLTEANYSRPSTVSIEDDILDYTRASVALTNERRSTRSSEASLDGTQSIGESQQPTLAEEIETSPDRRLSLLIEASRRRSGSTTSEASLQVDWEHLDRTEAQEEEEADDEEVVSTHVDTSQISDD